MKRSHDVAGWLGLSVCLMFASQLNAQRTFDEYFKMVKASEMGQREADFLKECGVDAASTIALYGVKLGAIDKERWSPRPMLGIGKAEGFTDFYTAEIRAVDAVPRMINTWWVTKDTGESQNAMYCLNEQSKVKAVLTLNIYEPVAGATATATRYLRRQQFLTSENKDHGTFVNADDAPVEAPKLTKQDMSAARLPARFGIAYEVIRDLWSIRKGPMVVPYEEQQSVIPRKK